jgi:hypothetical protein
MSKKKPVVRTFTKEELLESRGLPWGNFNEKTGESEKIYLDEITDHSRWSVGHRIVFQYDDKVYEAYYGVGATESQDESPWEYEDEIECTEVEEVEVVVKKWKPVLIDDGEDELNA